MEQSIYKIGRWKLRRLTKTDIAFLHFKLALAFMLWSPMWHNPTMQQELTGQILLSWVIVTFVGFLISAIGLIMGAQLGKERQKGFRVEMFGLWLLMAGPAVFLAVQLGVWISTGEQKWLAVMFPYVVMAAILARMTMVKSAMKTELFLFPGDEEGPNDKPSGRHAAR